MRVFELCIRTHPRLDCELPKLPVTRSAPNLTLTSEKELTFSHHPVLDREERVQLSWLPDTQGVTLRPHKATSARSSVPGLTSCWPGWTRGDTCT